MNLLYDCLSWLPERKLGTVIHIGAGEGDAVDGYAPLRYARRVLVEGDPDTLAQLRQRVPEDSTTRIIGEVVTDCGGAATWRRFNLPALNGLVERTGLEAYYPRLRSMGSQTVQSVALAELLTGLSITQDADRPNLLVLDVPGQEEALLASLPAELLRLFDYVLLCGLGVPEGTQGAIPAGQAVAWLTGQRFQLTRTNADEELLWPVSLLEFDERRLSSHRLQERIAELEEELHRKDALLADHAEGEAQRRRELQAQTKLANERLQQIEQLTKGHNEQSMLAGQYSGNIEALMRERNQLLEECQTQAGLAQERLQQIEQLTRGNETHAHQVNGELVQLRSERDRHLQAAGDLQERLSAATAQLTESQRRLDHMEQEKRQLTLRQSLLQEELAKAEGQLELIKDLLLREASL